jgi:RNA polymerase sigma-B factor
MAPVLTAASSTADTASDVFTVLAGLPPGHPDRSRLRADIVARYLPLVRSIAGRYRFRGEPLDDLVQAGSVGLLKAVDRFDAGRGLSFTTFAVPTIQGEIRRHFRDTTWSVHVSRGLQERAMQVKWASTVLFQELGRAPTVDEVAARAGISEEQALDALDCARAYSSRSLNEPVADAGGTELGETLGAEDPALDEVVAHEALRPALARLPAREQRILQLRFYGNLTQSEIARQLGISQMHVSRLLARALAGLRTELTE